MTLNSTTQLGLTFGELITLVTYTALVVGLYFNAINRIKNLEKDKENQTKINDNLTDMVRKIHESTIRIEGKLDLKQDRFK